MMSDDRAFTLSSCVVGNTSVGGGTRGIMELPLSWSMRLALRPAVPSCRGLVAEAEV